MQGENGGQYVVRSHKKQIIYYTPQANVTYYLDKGTVCVDGKLRENQSIKLGLVCQ